MLNVVFFSVDSFFADISSFLVHSTTYILENVKLDHRLALFNFPILSENEL